MKNRPQHKKRVTGVSKVKLSIRLMPEMDEKIRAQMRRQGDISKLVMEALDTFVISDARRQVPEIVGTAPATTIMLDRKVRLELKRIASRIGKPMNALVNAAVLAWDPE